MIELRIKVPRQIIVDKKGDIYRVVDETGKVWKEGKDATEIINWAIEFVDRHGISPDIDGTYELSEPLIVPKGVKIRDFDTTVRNE